MPIPIKYKVWIVVEEIDEENDEYRKTLEFDIKSFEDQEEAEEYAYKLEPGVYTLKEKC